MDEADPVAAILGPELVEGVGVPDRPPLFERTSDLLAEPHPGPAPFVVDQLLARGGICCLVGPYKVGKTWAVLDLAMAVASGTPALGRFDVERGPVLLILEESGRAAYHRRIDKLTRGRAIDPTRLSQLYFATNKGFNLSREEWRSRLLEEACATRPVLIVLDPLARIKGGSVDENSQLEMGPVLDFMRELRERSGSAVLFVHHTGHGEKGRMRGSSDMEAYWESKVTITETSDGNRLQADHREAEAVGPFDYALRFDGASDTARLEIADEDRLDDHDEAILRFIAEHPGATKEDVRRGVKRRGAGTSSRLDFLIDAGTVCGRPSQTTDRLGRPRTVTGLYPAPVAASSAVPPDGTVGTAGERPRPAVPPSRPYKGGNGTGGPAGTPGDDDEGEWAEWS